MDLEEVYEKTPLFKKRDLKKAEQIMGILDGLSVKDAKNLLSGISSYLESIAVI
ncbi:hypothetical protein LY28_00045 [Ruminiclostridium sufflavum DSM 19573]|uniref:Uncharacterized protein n=1 Tax=Ruminiclostridium sufflavum DSM 19573 TaxID=1121337 RepID=A0A318XQ21_9FIRM|nr:hypothetical protein [Ruminiclostridium sufflavum]PYG90165.1 hypothetical protein LY28_00045 [Ruminiclostridium sufflavum DSM 19573]